MLVQKISGLPAARVIGTGTMLDSARLRAELAEHFGVSPGAVDACVLGEHGDSSVVNWTSASIGGGKIDLPAKARGEIERRVKGAAMEIIKGRGATWDGIAAATTDLIRAIGNDERRVLPVSITDGKTAYSMPRIVGRLGVIATLSPEMNATERKGLADSIKAIQKVYKTIS